MARITVKKRKFYRQLFALIGGAAALAGLIVLAIVLFGGRGASTEPTETKETARPNAWSDEAYYTENGFLKYRDAECLVGIDVSAHQDSIDWQKVADAGVQFVLLRAGYRGSTEGKLYEDDNFRTFLKGARSAGLQVGVYFFSQATDEQEAFEEAAYVCELLEGETLELPVFYDWEHSGAGTRTASASDIDMTACALAFCSAVEDGGFRAGVYFNQTYGNNHLDFVKLKNYALWLAEYNETPTFGYHFDYLQYTDSGVVDGIEGTVDLDLMLISAVPEPSSEPETSESTQ